MVDSSGNHSIWYIVNVEGIVYRPEDSLYLMMIRGEGEEVLPGVLSFPGGKVEGAEFVQDVLETTVRREIMEEVCVEVHDDVTYVESHSFVWEGEPVVDVVFLCRYKEGQACPGDPLEVESVVWMSYEEVLEHEKAPEWTKESLRLAEKKRIELKW
jgi:NADH pyrophosphatase NudC (nudix superfamily)